MRILLVAHSLNNPAVKRLRGLVRGHAGPVDPAAATLDRAVAECRAAAPELTVVVLTPEHRDACLDAVRRLHDAGAGHLLAVGPATDPKLILKAMQAGAERFLDAAELETELAAAFARFKGRAEGGPKRAQRVLAVLSAGGGCGGSTVAVNLAALLAKEHGRCHLMDLHTGKADLAPLLDVTPQYTLADLCQNGDRVDKAMYDKMLQRHPSGIALLAGARDFTDIPFVTARGVGQALALAKELYPDVVLDLEDCFHEEQATALLGATDVVLVCRLDFTSVRHARRILDHLNELGVARDKVRVVANHHGMPDDLPVDEAEEAMGQKIARFIPHDPARMRQAANTGVPAALADRSAPVVNAVAALVGLEQAPEPAGRLVPRVRSFFKAQVLTWGLGGRPALEGEATA